MAATRCLVLWALKRGDPSRGCYRNRTWRAEGLLHAGADLAARERRLRRETAGAEREQSRCLTSPRSLVRRLGMIHRQGTATHLIEDGFDPLFVQMQVGHRHASPTAIYTAVNGDYKQRALADALNARFATAAR